MALHRAPPPPAAASCSADTNATMLRTDGARPSRFQVQFARVTNGQPLDLRPMQRRNLKFQDGVLLVRPHGAALVTDGGVTAGSSSVPPPRLHPLFEWMLLSQHDRPAAAAAIAAMGDGANPVLLRAFTGAAAATSNTSGSAGPEVVAALRALNDPDELEPELLVGPRHLVRIGTATELALSDDIPLRAAAGSITAAAAASRANGPPKPAAPTSGGRRGSLHAKPLVQQPLPPPPAASCTHQPWGVQPVVPSYPPAVAAPQFPPPPPPQYPPPLPTAAPAAVGAVTTTPPTFDSRPSLAAGMVGFGIAPPEEDDNSKDRVPLAHGHSVAAPPTSECQAPLWFPDSDAIARLERRRSAPFAGPTPPPGAPVPTPGAMAPGFPAPGFAVD